MHLLDPFICIDVKKYTRVLSTEAAVRCGVENAYIISSIC